MGSCFSKKNVPASSPPPVALPHPPGKKEESVVKKEIFIIKHPKSRELQRHTLEEKAGIVKVEESVEKGKNVSSINSLDGSGGGEPARASSCMKGESILIKSGRLSRSSSTGKTVLESEKGRRKYSRSKRSYDFDIENGKYDNNDGDGDDEAETTVKIERRRRTPSREREGERSVSRGRGVRRVSISPVRRSESPFSTNSNASGSCRPGKMISVPATVTVNKTSSSGGEPCVTRIQVMRNVGGASPRARSPARLRGASDNSAQNLQQPMFLSRSNSRKSEVSPFRRNPSSQIDTNIMPQKSNADNKAAENRNNLTDDNCKKQEQQLVGSNVTSEGLKTTRNWSSRLSRDLDVNPETPSTSYTALLLEDIQNFHLKSTTQPPPAFSLPLCLTKACSILEAVADLNSSTGSNLSTTDFRRNPNLTNHQINEALSSIRKGKQELRDPQSESGIVVSEDIKQPRFHKYVTVRRGRDGDMEEQESWGSNSFGGSHQQWTSSSCWEPNSAESSDRWSRSINDGGKRLKKSDADNQQSGIGRGRLANRVSHTAPVAVASACT